MILLCAHCGKSYDAAGLEGGSVVQCACGDWLSVPEADALTGASMIGAYVERWAAACGTTAEALAVDGGWEFIAGSAQVRIQHDAEDDSLTVYSTLLVVPEQAAQRLPLFTKLLELNYRRTGEARFALADSEVLVTFTRPTQGLDFHEFQRAIEEVARTADDYDDELQTEYGDAEPSQLPDNEL